MRRFSLLLVLSVGCQPAGPSTNNDPPSASLPAGVTQVTSLDPGSAVDDLAPIKTIIGDATVVGLGESVHTSGGYSKAKARLFRYLVENAGFRVLAIEAPRSEADFAAAYVATCEGGPTEPARHLGVWADTNVRDLLEWMCGWNQGHPEDRVHFFGFDVAEPWSDSPSLQKFLRVAAPERSENLAHAIATCDGVAAISADDYQTKYGFDKPIAKDAYERCLAGLAAIDNFLSVNERDLIAATSARGLDGARIDLRSLRGWQDQRVAWNDDPVRRMNARDVAMADVFSSIRAQRYPSLRTVVWAHDEHLAMRHGAITGSPADGAVGMGSLLDGELGAGYAAIGLVGYDVEINWPGLGCGAQAKQPSADSVEGRLHALGQPYLLVDLSARGTGAPLCTLGASYQFNLSETLIPAQQFRGLFYLDRSPPMDALLWSCK